MENLENWILHDSCDPQSGSTIMGGWPLIKIMHGKFPMDCIFIDIPRLDLLFDDKGVPIMERFDTENKFWTPQNPLPVNCIADEAEILALWDNPIFTPHDALFRQTQDEIRWMLQIKNKYPTTTILVIGQTVEIIKAWDSIDELAIRLQGFTNKIGAPNFIPEKKDIPTPVITCYMIQTFGEAPPVNKPKPIILTTVPNMKYSWYCRNCATVFPSKRCPACATPEQKDSLSKPGTYYCNEACQKEDWKRHKDECKK